MPLFLKNGGRARIFAALFLFAASFGAGEAAAVNFMVPRYGQAVALLPNRKIMVVGGADAGNASLNSVEILDTTRGSEFVSPVQGFIDNPMAFARSSATITVMPNGKVLVTGGWDSINGVVRSDAEVYTPNASGGAGSWATVAGMSSPRYNHTATLLLTGKILVCGGQSTAPPVATVTNTCDLFDPGTNTFSPAASMLLGRQLHTATILNDGTVWVAGGWNNDGTVNSNPPFVVTTERYTPDATVGVWQQSQPLNISRAYHTATLTGDNKVLVTGGYNGKDVNFKLTIPTITGTLSIPSKGVLNSSELFDPTGGSVVPGPPMQARVESHAAALLPHGLVSIYGGRGNIEPSNITILSPSPIFASGSNVDGNSPVLGSTQVVENITAGSGSVPLTFHLGTPVTGSIIDGDVEFIHPVVLFNGGKVVYPSNFDVSATGVRSSLKGTSVGCDLFGVCGYINSSFAVSNINQGTFSLSMPVSAAS
ncbi:MAG: hypothetical protein KGL74_09390, partial [Elusimicrobia bacterium]|nr:hypothetical protein [Elusimicrobiota bacterium]